MPRSSEYLIEKRRSVAILRVTFFAIIIVAGLWLAVVLPGEDDLLLRIFVGVASLLAGAHGAFDTLRDYGVRIDATGVSRLTLSGWRELRWQEVSRVRPGKHSIELSSDSFSLAIDLDVFRDRDAVLRMVRTHLPETVSSRI